MSDTELPLHTESGIYTYEQRRRTRLSVSALYFCQGIGFATWASRIPDIKTILHLSDAQLGTVLLILPVGQMLTMPFSGRAATRFGSKRVLIVAAALYALELTNIGLTTTMWQLMLALFVFGIFGNMANIAVNTQGVSAEKIFGRPILASFHGMWSAAGLVGALIGLVMTSLHVRPWHHFLMIAGLVLLVILLTYRNLVPGRGEAGARKPLLSKPDPVLLQLSIIGFCSMASEGAMFDWSGVYFKQVVQAPAALVTLGYASFMLMMTLGRFVGDRLILKWGRQRMMQVCGLMASAGMFISVLLPYVPTATFGFLMVGFGVSIMIPSVYSAAGKASTTSPGMALAVVSGLSYFGFLLGPPLIGYIAEMASLRYSYAVVGIFGILIAVMATKLKVFR